MEQGAARHLPAWRRFDENGRFAGGIGDPMALEVDAHGVVSVATRPTLGAPDVESHG